MEITAPAQDTFKAEYYAQYTHTDNTKSPCLGPVAWRVEERPAIELLSAVYSRLTFTVSELAVMSGRIRLYNDSACTTSASGLVTVSTPSHPIVATPLTRYGNFHFYVRHTDSANESGECTGPVNHNFASGLQSGDTDFSLHPVNKPRDDDPTPTFTLTHLDIESGTIQLFGNAGCHGAASGTVAVTSASATITANALTVGNHQFYVQHADSGGNRGRCVGLIAYRYSTESLTLALSSPSASPGSDDTPTFSVTGLEILNGTIRLFSDSACSSAASDPVAVTAATASITADTLTLGEHQFYVQHTDASTNRGRCTGPVAYRYREAPTHALSAGGSHSCLILDDDSLECWGNNANGQLGDGSTTDRRTPTEVDLGTDRTAKAISAGHQHTCAILDDDSLACWGSNNHERLGLGSGDTSNRTSPTTVDLGDDDMGNAHTAKAVSLGNSHTCAILGNGDLNCWGFNGSGRLGDGTATDRDIPHFVNLGGIRTAKAVSLGNTHTCAIRDDDSLLCWGSNNDGRLGIGDSSAGDQAHPTAVPLAAGRTAKAIALGNHHACAILDNDSLVCWGSGDDGRLGLGDTTDRDTPTAVDLGAGRTASSVSCGSSHTCALLDDGSVKCWGQNTSGQVGDGSNDDRDAPTAVNLGAGRTATALDVGGTHSCALLDDDSLVCWGSNGQGRLGDGSNSNSNAPTAVDFD